MSISFKLKVDKNPFKLNSERAKTLELSYNRIMELLDEYCRIEKVPVELKNQLTELITKAYAQKKTEYSLNDKFDGLLDRINFVVENSANRCIYGGGDFEIQNRHKRDVFYVNKLKHTVYE